MKNLELTFRLHEIPTNSKTVAEVENPKQTTHIHAVANGQGDLVAVPPLEPRQYGRILLGGVDRRY
jgi:hypothetical protein